MAAFHFARLAGFGRPLTIGRVAPNRQTISLLDQFSAGRDEQIVAAVQDVIYAGRRSLRYPPDF
jgi:hypothetical protein